MALLMAMLNSKIYKIYKCERMCQQNAVVTISTSQRRWIADRLSTKTDIERAYEKESLAPRHPHPGLPRGRRIFYH